MCMHVHANICMYAALSVSCRCSGWRRGGCHNIWNIVIKSVLLSGITWELSTISRGGDDFPFQNIHVGFSVSDFNIILLQHSIFFFAFFTRIEHGVRWVILVHVKQKTSLNIAIEVQHHKQKKKCESSTLGIQTRDIQVYKCEQYHKVKRTKAWRVF